MWHVGAVGTAATGLTPLRFAVQQQRGKRTCAGRGGCTVQLGAATLPPLRLPPLCEHTCSGVPVTSSLFWKLHWISSCGVEGGGSTMRHTCKAMGPAGHD